MSNLPKAVWEGSFDVLGVNVKVFQLDDGRRIIDAESMRALLEAMLLPTLRTEQDHDDCDSFELWMKGETPCT